MKHYLFHENCKQHELCLQKQRAIRGYIQTKNGHGTNLKVVLWDRQHNRQRVMQEIERAIKDVLEKKGYVVREKEETTMIYKGDGL